jgi:hypothetical protein
MPMPMPMPMPMQCLDRACRFHAFASSAGLCFSCAGEDWAVLLRQPDSRGAFAATGEPSVYGVWRRPCRRGRRGTGELDSYASGSTPPMATLHKIATKEHPGSTRRVETIRIRSINTENPQVSCQMIGRAPGLEPGTYGLGVRCSATRSVLSILVHVTTSGTLSVRLPGCVAV